jgi:hypothetical protein
LVHAVRIPGSTEPTIAESSAGNWKVPIRRRGWPTTVKTCRPNRDALAHPACPRDTDLVFWGDAREGKSGARLPPTGVSPATKI